MTTIIKFESQKREKLVPRRKLLFAEKLKSLLDSYSTCLVIDITNIGSQQIAEMRKSFHGRARFLFGKNTLIRKIIRDYVKEYKNTKLMKLMDLIKGNCGLVFTTHDIQTVRKEIISRKKQCSAKIGSIAPVDVFVGVGATNLDPTKTSMLQSMDIATRINGGQIDIIYEKHLIQKGEKVDASQSILLAELNIKPFIYGITVPSIYDNGNVIKDTSFMDLTSDDIASSFYNGIQQIAALCFSLSYPILVNVPHSLLNAYKETLGLSLMCNSYSFDGLQTVKQALEDAVNNIELEEELIVDTDPHHSYKNTIFTSDDDSSSDYGGGGGGIFERSTSENDSSDEEDDPIAAPTVAAQ